MNPRSTSLKQSSVPQQFSKSGFKLTPIEQIEVENMKHQVSDSTEQMDKSRHNLSISKIDRVRLKTQEKPPCNIKKNGDVVTISNHDFVISETCSSTQRSPVITDSLNQSIPVPKNLSHKITDPQHQALVPDTSDDKELSTVSQQFEIVAGNLLSTTIEKWAEDVGWSSSWELEDDIQLEFSATLEGDLEEVARQLVSSFKKTKKTISIELNKGNQVVRVYDGTLG